MASGLVIVVMGVSGCGKSTVGLSIAQQLGAHFKDADELHSAANIQRMSANKPLSDSDRLPWLEAVARYASEHSCDEQICVIACSALKIRYREILNQAGNVLYVYLRGSQSLIQSRLQARADHFMPPELLSSQFAALEAPDVSLERVIELDVSADVADVVNDAIARIRAHLID